MACQNYDNVSQENVTNILEKIKSFPDEKWALQLKSKPWWKSYHNKINNKLQKNFPGTHLVAMPDDFKLFQNFFEKAQFYDSCNCVFTKMEQSMCHENCHELLKDKKIDNVVTGIALSDDGLFRIHSWGVKDKHIVETTEIRLAYIGCALISK